MFEFILFGCLYLLSDLAASASAQLEIVLHSVQRILALITLNCNQPVNTGRRANTGRCVIFTWLKPYLNAHALIFSVCKGSSQPIANQLIMQKIWFQYF